jgi:hypothetical protein
MLAARTRGWSLGGRITEFYSCVGTIETWPGLAMAAEGGSRESVENVSNWNEEEWE